VLAATIADQAKARQDEGLERRVVRLARALQGCFEGLYSLVYSALSVQLCAGVVLRMRLLPHGTPAHLIHLAHGCLLEDGHTSGNIAAARQRLRRIRMRFRKVLERSCAAQAQK